MQLSLKQQLILQGKVCPYCGRDTVYEDSAVIYGKSYGMMYHCLPCKAYVGVHRGTDKTLGRVADAELRAWKIKAHDAFDPLWKTGIMSRQSAYKILAQYLDIPGEYCHIGYFSVHTCKKVVELMDAVINDLKQKTKK